MKLKNIENFQKTLTHEFKNLYERKQEKQLN